MNVKELPGEVPLSTVPMAQILPKYPATVTHGIPGLVIGGAIAGAFLLNHVLAAIWSVTPELIGLGLIVFGTCWVYSLIRAVNFKIIRDSEFSSFSICLAAVFTAVGFLTFFISWTAGHPSPEPSPESSSCRNHAGFREKYSQDSDGHAPYYVECEDGFTFKVPY